MSMRTTEGPPAPSSELARAAESIIGPTLSAPPGWRNKIASHFRYSKDLYSVGTAVITSLIALVSILITLQQFKSQMVMQRRSQAEALVSQFFTQVAELSALTANEIKTTKNASVMLLPDHVRQLIISRAQMLIDAEETGVHTDDILRFLTANGFGGFIGRSPVGDESGINVNYSAFEGTILDQSKFEGARFICLDFKDAAFDGVSFVNSWMTFARFRDSTFFNVNFEGSNFENVDFSGVTFEGRSYFKAAKFRNSNLSDIKLGNSFIDMDSSNLSEADRRAQAFASFLAEADSLVGTSLDENVENALIQALDDDAYQKLRFGTVEESSEGNKSEPLISERWESQCSPPLRARSQ